MLRRLLTTSLALALLVGSPGRGGQALAKETRPSPILVGSLDKANQQGDGTWRSEQCRFRALEGGSDWSYHEITLTIRCAVNHFPVYGGLTKALSVAQCESGLNELAWNPNGHAGVFQQAISSWPYRLKAIGPVWWRLRPSIFNGRSNVVVSIRQAHLYGWGAWSCA